MRKDYAGVNQEAVVRMTDYFLEQGGSYFDTAYVYHSGNSETAFKKAVALRKAQKTFTIADKMPMWMVKETVDYQNYFDEQLERCGIEYFDNYLLHNLGVKSYADALKHGDLIFTKNENLRKCAAYRLFLPRQGGNSFPALSWKAAPKR